MPQENTPESNLILPFRDNWRVETPFALHFFVFGVAWVLQVIFLGVWVLEKGLSATAIGSIIFMATLCRITCIPFISQICDRFGNRWLVIALLYGGALIPITGLMMVPDLPTGVIYWLSVLYAGLLGVSVMTLESYAVLCSKRLHFTFPFIRGFLSLGFALGSIALGRFFDWVSIDMFPVVVFISTGALLISLFLVKRIHTHQQNTIINPLAPLKSVGLLPLLLLAFFSFASMAPFMALPVIYYGEYMDFSASDMGLIIGVGTFAETLLFLWIGSHIRQVHNLYRLAFAFIGISFLRYGLYLYWENLWGMMVLQALHGIQFVIIHSLLTEFFRRHIAPHTLSSAQGLYEIFLVSGFGSGAGLAGYLYDNGGGQAMVYMSIITTIIAMIIMITYTTIQRHPK